MRTVYPKIQMKSLRRVTKYDKRHTKKAAEYDGRNIVNRVTGMSIAIRNV